MMHLLICSEEKTMDKIVERHENMVQVKRIKGAQRMWWSKERDDVHDNRYKIGDQGA